MANTRKKRPEALPWLHLQRFWPMAALLHVSGPAVRPQTMVEVLGRGKLTAAGNERGNRKGQGGRRSPRTLPRSYLLHLGSPKVTSGSFSMRASGRARSPTQTVGGAHHCLPGCLVSHGVCLSRGCSFSVSHRQKLVEATSP